MREPHLPGRSHPIENRQTNESLGYGKDWAIEPHRPSRLPGRRGGRLVFLDKIEDLANPGFHAVHPQLDPVNPPIQIRNLGRKGTARRFRRLALRASRFDGIDGNAVIIGEQKGSDLKAVRFRLILIPLHWVRLQSFRSTPFPQS